MTIPAGNNWCPDCDAACHDHASICTVCGATLVAPLLASNTNVNNNAHSSVSFSLTAGTGIHDEARETAANLRRMLQNMRSGIEDVRTAQDTILQQLGADRDAWQQIPQELLDPQGNDTGSTPTDAAALAAIPRTVINDKSSILYAASLTFLEQTISAVPAEFGKQETRIVDATIIVANPPTGKGGLSEETLASVRTEVNQRNRIILCFRRGDSTFAQKALLAAEVGCDACIVINSFSDPWPFVMKDSKKEALYVSIPVVMVPKATSVTHGSRCTMVVRKHNDSVCSVCTDNFAIGETYMILPSCGHIFHEKCACAWLTKHNTCPYCRHLLPAPGETRSIQPQPASHSQFYS